MQNNYPVRYNLHELTDRFLPIMLEVTQRTLNDDNKKTFENYYDSSEKRMAKCAIAHAFATACIEVTDKQKKRFNRLRLVSAVTGIIGAASLAVSLGSSSLCLVAGAILGGVGYSLGGLLAKSGANKIQSLHNMPNLQYLKNGNLDSEALGNCEVYCDAARKLGEKIAVSPMPTPT